MNKSGIPSYDKQIISLPTEIDGGTSMSMNVYQRIALQTDRMPKGLEMPILGLFGEVGSLLSALKKKMRDKAAFSKYDSIILEELGDVLWYFTTIASRVKLDLSILAQRMFRKLEDWDEVGSDEFGTFGDVEKMRDSNISADEFGQRLVELAAKVGELVKDYGIDQFENNRDKLSAHLVEVFRVLLAATEAADVRLDDAAYGNLLKTYSRWPMDYTYPPLVDAGMPKDERLPRQFTIWFEEQNITGRTFVLQKCNGIIIGDRLTDNKFEKDDYRFHDIFHISFAVHLGWSPVLRGLFKLKRKSKPEIDENQDGARASLIEEGVSTFIFSRGLERALFENIEHVDYDLLKSILEMIKGYEVERCALWQWEKAILDSFKVFRSLKKYRRGYVIADIELHTLEFIRREEYGN